MYSGTIVPRWSVREVLSGHRSGGDSHGPEEVPKVEYTMPGECSKNREIVVYR